MKRYHRARYNLGRPMRIVFWNICAGGGVRGTRIAERLARWAPDVVALCEFRATAPSLALSATLASRGLAHQCTTATGAANGLLLASRWPLRRIRLRAEPAEPGRWLLAELRAPSPLTVGVMHVPNRVTGRKDAFYAEMLAAIRRWHRGPALLLGDTNSGRPDLDEEVPVFGPREVAWLDAIERAGWADGFRTLHRLKRAYTWYSPNGRNGFRLDQAFLNRELQARLRAVVYDWGVRRRIGMGLALSDHAALLLDLADAAAGPQATTADATTPEPAAAPDATARQAATAVGVLATTTRRSDETALYSGPR
jgi:exonuclease III